MPRIRSNQQKSRTSEEDCVDSRPLLSTYEEEDGSIEELFLALEDLKKKETALNIELELQRKKFEQLKLKISTIIEQGGPLIMEAGSKLSSEKEGAPGSRFRLFTIETWGSAWNSGLVFTVMAENEVWARQIVREWLDSNGKGDHKIDKIQGLVSNDLRGIVNIGAKLLGE